MTEIKIRKRDGRIEEFDGSKIVMAVCRAMAEGDGVDKDIAHEIEAEIHDFLINVDKVCTVEEINEFIGYKLMEHLQHKSATRFIEYRTEQKHKRRFKKKYKNFSDEFLSELKHKKPPMTELGSFVFYRTYSRWLPEEKRRETWFETACRAVDYNCSLVPTSREEAESLLENVYMLRQFLSGRTFWVGGTAVPETNPMANYNCSFEIIEQLSDFPELFHLLMVGSGVGVRILNDDVAKIEKVRGDFEVIHKDFSPIPKSEREDSTGVEFFYNNTVKITVGDSKQGWIDSLDYFLKFISHRAYKNIKTIIFDYDNIRQQGEKLKTFGGTASGHVALMDMFKKIDKVIKKRSNDTSGLWFKLKPINALDIANIMGECVVVGGVRRTSEIILVDHDDEECINAKTDLYVQKNGKWEVNKELLHRQTSNNSIYYKKKPTRERLHWQLERMRYSGEPAWVNGEAGEKRRENFNGVNPLT